MSGRPFRLPRSSELLLLLVVALELLAPFVVKSYGVDGLSQLNLLAQFSRLFADGVWIPRWSPSGFFRFGAASFYFYPPVSLYVGSIIRVISGISDPRILFQTTGLVATIGCFCSAAYLLRSIAASNYQRWLGATLYAFAPMQIAELYSRSSLSTHVGYVFLPLVWAGAIGVVRNRDRTCLSAVILLGVSAALLTLSSVPLSMVTAMSILVAAVVYRRRITGSVVRSALLAALLAAALFLSQLTSILAARSYARLEDLVVHDPQYLLSALFHGAAWPAAYHVGLLYLCVALAALGAYQDGRNMSTGQRWFVRTGMSLTIGIAVLEIPALTKWLWSVVPPFTIIQGIWRYYGQLMLFVALFVAMARTENALRAARQLSLITIVGGLIPICFVISNVHLFAHSETYGEDPSEYRTIYSGTRQETIGHARSHQNDPLVMARLSDAEFLWPDSLNTIAVSLDEPQPVAFHRFQWPHWHLYANSRELVTQADSIGRTTALLPAGQYRLQWRLERTPLERIGLWVSGIAWISMLFFGVGVLINRYRKSPTTIA